MDEIKPNPGGQIITGNSKEEAALTAADIQLIKNRFKKNKKIIWYIIAFLLITSFAISAGAFLKEIDDFIRGDYGDYWEGLIPFGAGTGISLFFLFGIVAFNQEQKSVLSAGKTIYKGVVSSRKETKSRTQDVGGRTQSHYSYTVHLGDIYFTHEDLYYELDEGDTIEIHLSAYIVLYKNIIKNKKVSDLQPEVIVDYGFAKLVRPKQKAEEKADYLTDEEIAALQTQKKKRSKRILIVGIILLFGFGATAEFNLWIDSYTWDEALAFRLGFWGIPLAFFGLLFYRRVVLLSKDIIAGEKIIISEKLINKEESYSDAAKKYYYYLKAVRENIEVSKEIFDSIGPGDDFEIHKSKIRYKLLQLVILKNGTIYKNPAIFKTK